MFLEKIKNSVKNTMLGFNSIKKLKLLLRAIDNITITKDGDVVIDFNKNVVVTSSGSMVTYTKNGYNISCAKKTYINPEKKDEVGCYIERLRNDEDVISSMNTELDVYALKKEGGHIE